jgi:hypothetical protein
MIFSCIGRFIQWFYANLWYHSEFLVKDKSLRRPFTFIMRDLQHHHPYLFWPLAAGVFYGLFMLTRWNVYTGFLIGGFGWMLLAHLDWGEKYTPHAQEFPPYNPDK